MHLCERGKGSGRRNREPKIIRSLVHFFFFFLLLLLLRRTKEHHAPSRRSSNGHELAARALRLFFVLACEKAPRLRRRIGSADGNDSSSSSNGSNGGGGNGAAAAWGGGGGGGLDLDLRLHDCEGSPRPLREIEVLTSRSQLFVRESGALGPVPAHREDGRELGKAGGVPVRGFPFFSSSFFSFPRRKKEGEKSHLCREKKKLLLQAPGPLDQLDRRHFWPLRPLQAADTLPGSKSAEELGGSGGRRGDSRGTLGL